MKQLGVLDSAFFNLEQSNTPQHVGGVGIYDPSTAPEGFVRFKSVIRSFETRLRKAPLFRARVVQVPGGLDRPYWVIDEQFDVEFHLRHIALPKPGDWRQLCILLARLHSRPLDMSRPLWEAYIIEGLDNIPDLPAGSFAVYSKLHHSLIDGAGGQAFVAALHDLEPVPPPAEEDRALERLYADQQLGELQMLGRAAVNQLVNSVDMLRGAVRVGGDLARMAMAVSREEIPAPPLKAPRTRFNAPVGPHRVFDATSFPLADFRALCAATGSKLNDVALTVVGGALRAYLGAHAELPSESLIASIPLNMRTRRADSGEHNQVGSVFVELHTEIADPLKRLLAVRQSSSEAKQFGETSPLVDTMKLAGTLPPWLVRSVAHFYSDHALTRQMPLAVSTVVSNVAGPSFPLYCAGARLVRYCGLGVLTPGVGLFHMVFSSADVLTLSVLANRDVMPDPAFYRQCVEESFEALRRAASASRLPKETAAAKPRKRVAEIRRGAAARRRGVRKKA